MNENIIDWRGEFEKNPDNAIRLVYHQFEKRLWHCAFKFIGHREDAEDITADVFRKFYERQAGFDHIHSIVAFLYITCKNECLNYLKAKNIRRKNLAVLASISDSHTTTLPFFRQAEAEVLAHLSDSINDLPGETQKVILESLLESNAEKVARKLGKNGQNVRNLKSKGIQLLKEALQKKVKKTFLFVLLIRAAGCFKYSIATGSSGPACGGDDL